MTQETLTDSQPVRGLRTPDAITVPQIPQRPRERTVHGDTTVADHSWLRDPGSSEVAEHLDAENAYTDHRTSHLGELRAALARELAVSAPPTELLIPVRTGGWWYLDRPRYPAGHGPDASLSRVPDGAELARDAAGLPVLEEGELLPGEQMLIEDRRAVFGIALSAEHHLLARVEASAGDSLVTVVDLATSEVIDQEVRRAGPDLAFSVDGQWLLYLGVDEYGRGHQIRRHRIGTAAEDDTVVLDEPDQWAEVELSRSRDGSTLLILSRSVLSAHAWTLDLADPTSAPRSVTGRRQNPGLVAEHAGDRLLVLDEDETGRSVLSEVALNGPGHEIARHDSPPEPSIVLTARDGEHFEGVEAFASFVALQVRSGGLPGVRIIPRREDGTLDTLAIRTLGHGGELEAVRLDANPAWDQDTVRYRLDSLLTPTTIAQCAVDTGEATVLRRAAAPRIDPEQYLERRLWAEAADGTRIPVSLLHRRDITPDGSAAGVLQGYGAFGTALDPMLALPALPLLDRGLVVAIAHVRGGGEMGPAWHHGALRADKSVSFTDYLACAQLLVDSGWVAADRLGACGSGAGGLLVAAAANLAPERFRAVVAEEPLVDPLNSLLDPGVMLTLPEWAEWGDPAEDEAVYRALRSYSPAENVRAGEYPAVLAHTAREGSEVPCTEAAVWIAELRARTNSEPDRRPVLLRCDPASDSTPQARRTEAMAWLLDQLGAAGSP